MKNRFIPLQIEKVLEERGQHPFSVQVLLEALELLESEYSSFCTQEGSERAETVFSYRTVKRALQQCLAYHQNNNSSLTFDDNIINYEYAYWKLKKAEELIEEE
jgi:hypothetical protein